MPRKRNPENTGLPDRWRFLHGAYRYQVPPGKEAAWDGKKTFTLGRTLPEAYRTWADRLEGLIDVRTVADLLDRYGLEVVPTKAAKTQVENARHIRKLRTVFGTMKLSALKPVHVYRYVDARSRKKETTETSRETGGTTIAHREIEVLSHAFTMAVKWGYVDRHPFKNEVRLEGEKPRDRYVEDWEIAAALSLPAVLQRGGVLAVQAYIQLKLLTGLRRSDLLRLRMADIQADGIHCATSKTGKRLIFAWDEAGYRRAAVDAAVDARPCLSPFLFCTRKGESYWDETIGEPRGWKSMWQRFMARVLKETTVTQRFTEHDIRAKVGSDQETLERAQRLLGHLDSRTTARVYRRKPEVV